MASERRLSYFEQRVLDTEHRVAVRDVVLRMARRGRSWVQQRRRHHRGGIRVSAKARAKNLASEFVSTTRPPAALLHRRLAGDLELQALARSDRQRICGIPSHVTFLVQVFVRSE